MPGHYLCVGGPYVSLGRLLACILLGSTMSVLEFQTKLEQKVKIVVKKYDDWLFFLFRMILYICFCSTIKIKTVTDLTEQLIIYFEIVNYLLILAIVILFPSLDDFRQV